MKIALFVLSLVALLISTEANAQCRGGVCRPGRRISVCGGGGCVQQNQFFDPNNAFNDNLVVNPLQAVIGGFNAGNGFNNGFNSGFGLDTVNGNGAAPSLLGVNTGLGNFGQQNFIGGQQAVSSGGTFDPSQGQFGGFSSLQQGAAQGGLFAFNNATGQFGNFAQGTNGVGLHSARQGFAFPSNGTFFETGPDGQNRNIRIATGPQTLVVDPATGQRINPFPGMLIVNSGASFNGQTVFVPASMNSVQTVLNSYINQARGSNFIESKKLAVLNGYGPFMQQVFAQNGQVGQGGTQTGTGPGTGGGAHTGPGDISGTQRRETSTAPSLDGTPFKNWWDRWLAAADADKTKIDDQVSTFASEKVDGKPWSYKVLNQECASKANPSAKQPATIYLFSSKVKEGDKEVTKTHVVIKPVEEKGTKEEAAAAWAIAKTEDTLKDGTKRDLGKASTPEGMEKSSLVSWFVPGDVQKKNPEIEEAQVHLRPIVKEDKIIDFATKYVFKNKEDLSLGKRWDKAEKDVAFFCKTKGGPEISTTEKDKQPSDTGKVSPAEELKTKAKSVIEARCVSCHKEGKARGERKFDNDLFASQEAMERAFARAIVDGDMPPGGKLSDDEKEAIRAYAESVGVTEAKR